MSYRPKISPQSRLEELNTGSGKRSAPIVRALGAADGAIVAELVRATRTLEPATGYAYVMMADLFGDTCALAERDGQPVGCVIAFRPPRAPHVLFVWQIGVHPRAQRGGVAHAMLDAILERPGCAGVCELHATVAPSNTASEQMFRAYAARRGATIERIGGYPSEYFADAHEPERLFCLSGVRAGGPLAPQ